MHLRFARCEVCFLLTQQIGSRSEPIESKLAATRSYRDHLHDQYVDRSVAWSLQELSKDHHSDTICMVLDGMDQAKFAIPSSPALRATASVARHISPTLKLHGCWCFGWTLDLHVLDESTKHDSSCIIEIVARCLERVSEISQRQNLPFPKSVILISDNCVRDPGVG